MIRLRRFVFLILSAVVASACLLTDSPAKKDLSTVVLQPDDVPADFSNQAIFSDQDIEHFFQLGDNDSIENYAGVSYLNPQDGLNYIYSVVVAFDDQESAESVYKNFTGQVNSQLHRQKDKIGDQSLVFSTPTGTSFYSIWRSNDMLGYVAVITRRVDIGFGFKEIVGCVKTGPIPPG